LKVCSGRLEEPALTLGAETVAVANRRWRHSDPFNKCKSHAADWRQTGMQLQQKRIDASRSYSSKKHSAAEQAMSRGIPASGRLASFGFQAGAAQRIAAVCRQSQS
jgi:hypothetical protein